MENDFYKVLGLSRDATPDQIKHAYRLLSKRLHPDVSGGDRMKFEALKEAYEVLSDPEAKTRYDAGQWHPSQERVERQNAVVSIMLQVLNAGIDQAPPRWGDFVDEVWRRNKNEIQSKIDGFVKEKTRVEAFANRIKVKDDESLAGSLVKTRIDDLSKTIAQGQFHLSVFQDAIDLLKSVPVEDLLALEGGRMGYMNFSFTGSTSSTAL